MAGGLRVVGGKAKGRKLRSVPGDTTRPVTDRVKEAVFNILGPDIENASLLDLFSGTGAIGIEALSRGAAYVLMNDLNRLPVDTIRANLKSTELTGGEVKLSDAFRLLESRPARAFEYIYIAPPQYMGLWKKALQSVDAQINWLAEDGWVIVQINPVEFEDCELVNLEEFDRRKYGSTLVIFYQRKTTENDQP